MEFVATFVIVFFFTYGVLSFVIDISGDND